MQIELLDTFLDLVETRSFHRTADRLAVTQSTVSARVVALETALGTKLFSRSRAGTDLTTEGLRFESHARTLRREWNEARRAVEPSGTSAMTLRIGIQNDLVEAFLGDLVGDFQAFFSQASLYVEPDYSTQMCRDLVLGAQDLAVLFTPKPHPDLHFVSLGDLPYQLISSDCATRAEIKLDSYVQGQFSPAFEHAHRAALPELIGAPLAVGQSSAIVALLEARGGTGFVLANKAAAMTATGRFQTVADVEPIGQPIYFAMHQRNRMSFVRRRLLKLLHRRFFAQEG